MNGTLWNKNFIIITLGTLVSMCGVVVLSFSSSLLILDQTGSLLYYALFLMLVNLPAVVSPLLFGPILDKFSRQKIIVILDYTSSIIAGFCAVGVYFDILPTWSFYVLGGVFGAVGGAYNVTYESFYPSLITRGKERQAYSISSLIYPIASTLFLPLSAIMYEKYGLFVLYGFTSIAYFTAATFETQIKVIEQHLIALKEKVFEVKKKSTFIRDFKEGINYLKGEKGLIVITSYFFFLFYTDGLINTVTLPFFKNTEGYTVFQYSVMMAIMTLGRLIGGGLNYKFSMKADKRFAIASSVYLSLAILHGVLFFFNIYAMCCMSFAIGILSVTSFNIRTSSTQRYVKNEVRGRYNGVFFMVTMFASTLGQLTAGLVGEIIPTQILVLCASSTYVIGYFLFVLPNAKHVKKIYNCTFE